jgi:hypothetical protein
VNFVPLLVARPASSYLSLAEISIEYSSILLSFRFFWVFVFSLFRPLASDIRGFLGLGFVTEGGRGGSNVGFKCYFVRTCLIFSI